MHSEVLEVSQETKEKEKKRLAGGNVRERGGCVVRK